MLCSQAVSDDLLQSLEVVSEHLEAQLFLFIGVTLRTSQVVFSEALDSGALVAEQPSQKEIVNFFQEWTLVLDYRSGFETSHLVQRDDLGWVIVLVYMHFHTCALGKRLPVCDTLRELILETFALLQVETACLFQTEKVFVALLQAFLLAHRRDALRRIRKILVRPDAGLGTFSPRS